MLERSGDKEGEFSFLHYTFLNFWLSFVLVCISFCNLKLIQKIMKRKKLKGKRGISSSEPLFIPFFKAHVKTFLLTWGLNKTLNSRGILLTVYTTYLGFRKAFLEILDPEIAGFPRNVYHANTHTLYLLKMHCIIYRYEEKKKEDNSLRNMGFNYSLKLLSQLPI